MGVDSLPDAIKNSSILTGNDLGMLGNTEELPDHDSIEVYVRMHKNLQHILQQASNDERTKALHQLAHELLLKKEVESAWKVLLSEQLSA
jgi:hypothetical protein